MLSSQPLQAAGLSAPLLWLALEFMLALEQGIYAACEGCMARPAPPKAVMAFYTANKKVGGGGGRRTGGGGASATPTSKVGGRGWRGQGVTEGAGREGVQRVQSLYHGALHCIPQAVIRQGGAWQVVSGAVPARRLPGAAGV
jgi:hypothetical protein